ncbi:hypothetical protein CF326_g9976, partial [Tilletia indica]
MAITDLDNLPDGPDLSISDDEDAADSAGSYGQDAVQDDKDDDAAAEAARQLLPVRDRIEDGDHAPAFQYGQNGVGSRGEQQGEDAPAGTGFGRAVSDGEVSDDPQQ